MYCYCGGIAYHEIDDRNPDSPPKHYYKCAKCGNIMDQHTDPYDEWHKARR